MKILRYAVGITLGMTVSMATHAGALSKAAIGGQVQQLLDNGKVTGCGVTLSAIEEGVSARDVLHVFTGSVMLGSPTTGLLKGRASTVTGAQVQANKLGPASLKALKTEMVWVKAQGSEATTFAAGQGIQRSEDPGYIMYLTPIDPLLAVVDAIQDGKPIQIGMRSSKKAFDVVLFGKVSMPDDDKAALANCMREWATYLVERYSTPDKGSSVSTSP